MALPEPQRTALLDAAARDPSAAAGAIEGLGADGMTALDETNREALIDAAARSPAAAGAIEAPGANGFAAPPDEWRGALIDAAARSPAAADAALAAWRAVADRLPPQAAAAMIARCAGRCSDGAHGALRRRNRRQDRLA